MAESLCLDEVEVKEDVRLSEDEVVALMLNMIAFKGDWEAHLKFLNGLNEKRLWKYDQIPVVKEMQQKDARHNIQDVLSLYL